MVRPDWKFKFVMFFTFSTLIQLFIPTSIKLIRCFKRKLEWKTWRTWHILNFETDLTILKFLTFLIFEESFCLQMTLKFFYALLDDDVVMKSNLQVQSYKTHIFCSNFKIMNMGDVTMITRVLRRFSASRMWWFPKLFTEKTKFRNLSPLNPPTAFLTDDF